MRSPGVVYYVIYGILDKRARFTRNARSVVGVSIWRPNCHYIPSWMECYKRVWDHFFSSFFSVKKQKMVIIRKIICIYGDAKASFVLGIDWAFWWWRCHITAVARGHKTGHKKKASLVEENKRTRACIAVPVRKGTVLNQLWHAILCSLQPNKIGRPHLGFGGKLLAIRIR